MNSSTAPEFWKWFGRLPDKKQARARRAFRLWRRNPRDPSLQFKKVGKFWSVPIDDGYRALGVQHHDIIIWFYIGPHDRYETRI
jgi:hypothetical protein